MQTGNGLKRTAPIPTNLPAIKVFPFKPSPYFSGLRINIDQVLVPLGGKITLVATLDNILIGWINFGTVRPLYNSKGDFVIHYLDTHQTAPRVFHDLQLMGVFSLLRHFRTIHSEESSEEGESSNHREQLMERERELERVRDRELAENPRPFQQGGHKLSEPPSEFPPPRPLKKQATRSSKTRHLINPEQNN